MTILSQLTKLTETSQKRPGRGIGSGKGGHTSGRGAKGDKVRGKSKLTFDGTKIKKGWIKRLPFLRGKNRLSRQVTNLVFSLDQIEKWYKAEETVDINTLSKKVKEDLNFYDVKVLSGKKLSKALKFKGINLSESARKQIISAGGNIE